MSTGISTAGWRKDPQSLLISYCGGLLIAQAVVVIVIVESLAITGSSIAGLFFGIMGGLFVYDGFRRLREQDPTESTTHGARTYAILGAAVLLTGLFILFLLTP